MIRLILRSLAVLVPVILYILWRRYRQHLAGQDDAARRAALAGFLREASLAALVIAAVSIACFVQLRLQENHAAPSGRYVPAQMRDGRIVPGHFK